MRIAEELRAGTRHSDGPARLGGEEFGLLLPGCGPEEAARLAEQLRQRVQTASEGWPTPITVSIGVASIPLHATTAAGLMHAADLALYAAKGAGRNRVHTAAAQGPQAGR